MAVDAEKEEVERRVRAVVQLEEKKWVGGGVDVEYAKECAKERMVRNPSVLLLDSVTAQCNAWRKRLFSIGELMIRGCVARATMVIFVFVNVIIY